MCNHVATRGCPSQGIGTFQARNYVRIVGNAKRAYIETAPVPFGKNDPDFVPQRIEGQVEVNSQTGVTKITSAHISDESIDSLERDFRCELLDARLIEPEQSTRYKIGMSYVALDRVSAERLSEIFKNKIEITQGVNVVHSTEGWALWSDNRLTTSIGLPKWGRAIKTITSDAESIISLYWGADGGTLPDKLERVSQVAKILSETVERVELSGGGIYAPPRIIRMRVRFKDDTETDWWLSTQGYMEGYEYNLFSSKEALLADIAPKPEPEPTYVPMQGQLWEPCERCGCEPVYMPLHLCQKCWPRQGD